MKIYYVYILQCSDGSYYTGITNDLDRRIAEHKSGIDPSAYTFKKRPLTLAYYAEFNNPENAITFEKQIKGWSRKKKEALINENYDELVRLSNLKNNSKK